MRGHGDASPVGVGVAILWCDGVGRVSGDGGLGWGAAAFASVAAALASVGFGLVGEVGDAGCEAEGERRSAPLCVSPQDGGRKGADSRQDGGRGEWDSRRDGGRRRKASRCDGGEGEMVFRRGGGERERGCRRDGGGSGEQVFDGMGGTEIGRGGGSAGVAGV